MQNIALDKKKTQYSLKMQNITLDKKHNIPFKNAKYYPR